MVHEWETLMAAINLKGMDVDALLALRADIDKRLSQKRSELEKQLSRLGADRGGARPSSDRAASSTISRSIRRWAPGRDAKPAGRKSKQAAVPVRMHNFRVWAKNIRYCGSKWIYFIAAAPSSPRARRRRCQLF